MLSSKHIKIRLVIIVLILGYGMINAQTYETLALYLPTSFEAQKEYSIIFIFDPGGEGKRGINQFIKSSETYGYILVCSNNARNSSYDRNFNITNRLFEFIYANFKIKQNELSGNDTSKRNLQRQ